MAKRVNPEFIEIVDRLPSGWVAFEFNDYFRGWYGTVGKGETPLFRINREYGYWVEKLVDGSMVPVDAPEGWPDSGQHETDQVVQLILDNHP